MRAVGLSIFEWFKRVLENKDMLISVELLVQKAYESPNKLRYYQPLSNGQMSVEASRENDHFSNCIYLQETEKWIKIEANKNNDIFVSYENPIENVGILGKYISHHREKTPLNGGYELKITVYIVTESGEKLEIILNAIYNINPQS